MISKREEWTTWSYVLDWLVAGLLLLGGVLLPHWLAPFCRHYVANDPLETYPLLSPPVSPLAIYILSGVLPPCVFFAFHLHHRSVHDLHHACLSVFESLSLSVLLCNAAALTVGRRRPNWDEAVKLAGTIEGDPCAVGGLNGSRNSFPSLPASVLFASMTVVSLYLAAKWQILRPGRGEMHKALAAMCPMILAGYLTLMALQSYQEFFEDTVTGWLLGVLCGLFAYHLNYPSVGAVRCEHPITRTSGVVQRRFSLANTRGGDNGVGDYDFEERQEADF